MLTKQQLAAKWQVSPRTIERWVNRKWNPLPQHNFGPRCVRFDELACERWKDRSTRYWPNKRISPQSAKRRPLFSSGGEGRYF